MRCRPGWAVVLLGALNSQCTTGGDTAMTPDERVAPAAAPDVGAPVDPELQAIARAALADAAGKVPAGAAAPRLVSVERVTWSDGSLGCPQPGMMYPQALVPGVRIRVSAGAALLDYHASAKGALVLCPADRSREPVKGGGRV